MEHILNEVRNFIEKNNLISKNDKVGCAFSGGTDSVFMTYILNKLSYEMNFKVIAIHVNHMLRGEFSLRDENFSKNFCKLNCIEFKSYEVDVKKYSLDNKISIEMAGRFLRYDIFENLKNRGIINKCALAHHADDDVETILMRIFRGTGIKGIEGIKEIRNDFYIRPILFLRRKDHIEKFLNDNSIKYMTDDSNFSEDYLRNKLRLNIIPAINENFSMDITNSILNLKEMSKTDNDFFEKLVKIYLEKYVEFRFNEVLIRNECFKLHNSILFRLIRTTIEIFSGDINDINLKHVKCIVESFNLKFGGKIQIRKRLYCIKDLCGLKFVNSISNLNENSEESHVLLNKIEISNLKNGSTCEIVKEVCFLGNKIRIVFNLENNLNYNKVKSSYNFRYFNFDKVESEVVLRNRREGDHFKPFGMKSTKKLKDFLINEKAKNRNCIPIICFDNNISWVFNFRNSEDYKILSDTKKVVKMKLEYV